MAKHSSAHWEQLFTHGVETHALLHPSEVQNYRTKTIRAGSYMEVEAYPIWNTANTVRAARAAATRETQRNLNDRNAKRRITRLINANFTPKDICVHLTYATGELPDEQGARRDIRNYIKRIRTLRRRLGLPELRYIYVIEFEDGEGTAVRVHHHVIMSGMDRDLAERTWKKGRANADRLQPDETGFAAIAHYITKTRHCAKRWAGSRNLKEPIVTTSDSRLSRRRVARLAADCSIAAKEIFENICKGYVFTDCVVRVSELVAGAWIYARLRKRE